MTIDEIIAAKVELLAHLEAEKIDAACLEMMFGNAGALKGVLIDAGANPFEPDVRLVDPAEDPRAVAGTIVFVVATFPAPGYYEPPMFHLQS